MAWDFSTEPEFQEKLDWIAEFVANEIEPLDLAFSSHVVYDRSHPIHRTVIRSAPGAGEGAGPLGVPPRPRPRRARLRPAQARADERDPRPLELGRRSVFGCQAPDSGNAEILAHYGTEEQKAKYLQPLLDGEIVSCYSMTEPQAGSDPARVHVPRVEGRRRVGDRRREVVLVEPASTRRSRS